MSADTIPFVAFELADRPVRPLTADEVLRMVEAGILSAKERVELLHGVLTEVSPKRPEHGSTPTRRARSPSPVRYDVGGRLDLNPVLERRRSPRSRTAVPRARS